MRSPPSPAASSRPSRPCTSGCLATAIFSACPRAALAAPGVPAGYATQDMQGDEAHKHTSNVKIAALQLLNRLITGSTAVYRTHCLLRIPWLTADAFLLPQLYGPGGLMTSPAW